MRPERGRSDIGARETMAKTPRSTGRSMMKMTKSRDTGACGVSTALFAVLLGVSFGVGTDVQAQSRFGCAELDATHWPSIEGVDGVFFQIGPDLQTHHAMTDETVGRVAALSAAFEARGTELVFVPLPTKALAMPAHLGPEAEKFAYDAGLAATIYEDQIARLSAAEVSVVDARRALLGVENAFFRTDPRLSNEGLRALVAAVGAGREDWPLDEAPGYVTSAGGSLELDSIARDVLQMSCWADVPSVVTTEFRTVATGADYAMDDGPRVVFAGPSGMADARLNLAGFLSEAAGRRAAVLGGETAFAALTAFVTSDGFRQSPPEVLIWAVPVWETLSSGGDQPVREALAAIEDVCVADLDSDVAGANRLRVALGEAGARSGDTLMLDNRQMVSATAVFHFVGLDGQERTRAVVRPDGAMSSGRFYMPLSGLWEDGVAYVDIETPLSDGPLPVVALCRGGA